jgi:hypothetical protein
MNLTPALIREIGQAMCRPVGSATFEYSSKKAFLRNAPAGVLVEIPAGGHLFRLERTSEGVLRFFHSSPGTGTRVAVIPLKELPDFEKAFLAFTWTPEDLSFYCGPRIPGGELLSAKGEPSAVQFRMGADGCVILVGDEGVQMAGVRVVQDGKPILAPTAIEAWTSTTAAIEELWTGKSDQGFMFEVVQTSATLSVLVSGLEAYAKTRLLEVESEGIEPDWTATFTAFASRAERESNRLQELQQEAAATGASVLQTFVDTGRVNFQSYDHLKRVYKTAYGIRLGEMGLESQVLEKLQLLIGYRHRLVHVSPLLGVLNEECVPSEEPVFTNRLLADAATKCFDTVISALHRATLGLRRAD